ncbi:MAG: hypothetical protein ABIX37_02545 [Gammaproteobacteria bacterium]
MAPTLNALIEQLWCLHWTAGRPSADTVARLRASGVFLDTCLRQLAFGLAPRPMVADEPAGELTTGAAAYRLLLEVASGLRSAVPGETNVFGQFRRATEQAADQDRVNLHPIVAALQADTRALRSRHLQGVAGGSYGSLVRKLLAPQPGARVLFVGTGDLTRSMLPLFRAWDVGAWNHRPGAPLADVCRWFSSDEADAAAAWATDMVFTTPVDPAHDTAWSRRLRSHTPRCLVHLGQRRGAGPSWSSLVASFHLDDVFELAGARDQQRSQQLATAMAACAALVEVRLGDASPRRLPSGLRLASA